MLQHGGTPVRCPNYSGATIDKYSKCRGNLCACFGSPNSGGEDITNGESVPRGMEWTIHCPDCKTYLPMQVPTSGTNLSDWGWLTEDVFYRERRSLERARASVSSWSRRIDRLIRKLRLGWFIRRMRMAWAWIMVWK